MLVKLMLAALLSLLSGIGVLHISVQTESYILLASGLVLSLVGVLALLWSAGGRRRRRAAAS